MSSDPYSRPLACIQALGADAADAHRFQEKRVLLTGEVEILKTPNGRWIALYALRLLIRFCKQVEMWIPYELSELRGELEALGAKIAFAQPVLVSMAPPNFNAFDAVLHIGTEATSANMTIVTSNGWLARVTDHGRISGQCGQANPLGALAAASLGAAEVFKRLAGVRPERGSHFHQLTFSTYDWSTGSEDPGPTLPQSLKVERLLVTGQGAIGNGVTLVLADLPFEAEIFLLDRQPYGPENLGTCVLMEPNDDKNKAAVNAAWLRSRGKPNVKELEGEVEKLLKDFGSSIAYPTVIVNGLDNLEARHAIQELWPEFLVDGAIGTFACQVVSHEVEGDLACLKCLFELPAGPHPHDLAVQETGLRRGRVADAEAVVTEADVESAPPEKMELLRSNIGRKICSVIGEAEFARIARNAGSFAPSVPFVATIAAVLCVATLVRRLTGGGRVSARFQFDALVGPQNGEHLNERAKPGCFCQERKSVIAELRRSRRAA